MLKPSESLCCDNRLIQDPSLANRFQKDLAHLMRLFYTLSREHVDTLDITILQGYVLMDLQLNGQVMMTEISSHMRLSISTMTRVVDKLVKAGLVQRVHGESDRRVVYLELTPAGGSKSTAFRISQSLLFQRLLAGLSPADQETVLSGLDLLAKELERFPKRPDSPLEHLEAAAVIGEEILN